jgi:hypothetical protein
MSQHANIQIGPDHYRFTQEHDGPPFFGRWSLMHQLDNTMGRAHSIGYVGEFVDEDALQRAAIAHSNRVYDTGNCDGYIPVRRSLAQKVHWGRLDQRVTRCGLELPVPGVALRVPEPPKALLARGEFCGRCEPDWARDRRPSRIAQGAFAA